jgi:prepilin-type N-terminal cleavage/methylation domain-containing protein
MKRRRLGGYTLVELLVAIALLALIGVAIVGAFAGGLRVWERARVEVREAAPAAACAQIRRDLANACLSRGAAFEGGPQAVVFASRAATADPRVMTMCRLEYAFDPAGGRLRRTACAVPSDAEGRAETVLDRTEECAFLYYGEEAAGEGGWTDTWTGQTNLPAAVRVRLRCRTDEQPVDYSFTALCPAR